MRQKVLFGDHTTYDPRAKYRHFAEHGKWAKQPISHYKDGEPIPFLNR